MKCLDVFNSNEMKYSESVLICWSCKIKGFLSARIVKSTMNYVLVTSCNIKITQRPIFWNRIQILNVQRLVRERDVLNMLKYLTFVLL